MDERTIFDMLGNKIEQTEKKNRRDFRKVNKGAWRMPRLSEAKKDVISCEKRRGGANNR